MERKGFLTDQQELALEEIIRFKNPIIETFDGVAFKVLDNMVLEKLKNKYIDNPEILNDIYTIIDTIFEAINIKS